MKPIRRSALRAAVPVVLAVAALPNGQAAANWEGAVASPTAFFARWSYVPDIDQRRLNLPNNGNMYCVPTAFMNWMAYIAHHGFPGVSPPGDQTIYHWHSDLPFIDMTGWLYDLGLLMETDGNLGTKGNKAVEGFIEWMNGKGFPYLLYDYGVSDDFTPRHSHISDWTLRKCPVVMGVGWYAVDTAPPPFPPIDFHVRVGGHSVTLVSVARSGTDREVGIRDPASDNNLQPFGPATQSPATTEYYGFLAEQVVHSTYGARIMDKVENYGSGYFDGYTVIVPLSVLTTVDDGLKIGIHTPAPWSWESAPPLQEIDIGSPTQIADARNVPGTPEVCIVTEADPIGGKIPSKVWRVNLVTGQATEFASFANAKKIVFGRKRQLYVLDGSTIRRFNYDASPPVELNSVFIGGSPDAIAFNDFNDTLLIHSPGGDRIFILKADLSETALPILDLPPDEVILDGQTFMVPRPGTSHIFLTSEGSQAVYLVAQNLMGATVLTLMEGEITAPESFNMGDDYTMYISENGLLRVYPPDPIHGTWVEDPGSPFAGLATLGPVEVPRSRSNQDPPSPEDPAFFNVLPTQFAPGVVDCIHADADASGVIDFDDVIAVLANWLSDYSPGTGPGDANADGIVDFDDVVLVLSLWLTVCS